MNFLDKLERKFGRFCIPNLMLYIMIGNVIVFFLSLLMGMELWPLLCFHPESIMRGQIWRLVTWIFLPEAMSPIWFLFFVLLYYSIGRELEYQWGSFKFNMYYLLGMIFSIAAFFIGGSDFIVKAQYINLSLFLAYAALFPNRQFLIWGIIPIKVKYLAALDVAFLLASFVQGGTSARLMIIVSLLNFILFFGPMLLNGGRGRQTSTQKQFKKQKKQMSKGGEIKQVAFHRCVVCGKTELTNPEAEFRYCSKCNGNYEYCMEHLHNHEHKV